MGVGEWVYVGFPGASAGKESACNAGDLSLIPELGWSPGEGYGNPLQYSFLENSVDYHGVAESWTWLSDFHFQWVYACGYFSNLFASTFYVLSLLLIMKSDHKACCWNTVPLLIKIKSLFKKSTRPLHMLSLWILTIILWHRHQNPYFGDFLAGSVVRTLHFHCWGLGFDP